MSYKQHLVIEQGANFEEVIDLKDENGYSLNTAPFSATGIIKKHHESVYYHTMPITVSNGSLYINMTAAQTANVKSGRYVYTINLINSSNAHVTRLMEGQITVSPQA